MSRSDTPSAGGGIVQSAFTAEVLTEERCTISELMNTPATPAVSLATAGVAPGVTTRWHRVAVDEYYVIVAGTGLMEIGDAPPFPVAPGVSLHIPARTPQRISNTGSGLLRFHCLCLPRFRREGYEDLGDDSRPR